MFAEMFSTRPIFCVYTGTNSWYNETKKDTDFVLGQLAGSCIFRRFAANVMPVQTCIHCNNDSYDDRCFDVKSSKKITDNGSNNGCSNYKCKCFDEFFHDRFSFCVSDLIYLYYKKRKVESMDVAYNLRVNLTVW